MIYFFTVAALARSGTMWFSRVFTTEHSYCYHELTTLLRPYPTNTATAIWYREQVGDHNFEQMQRRWLLQCYPEYFLRLWERATFGQYIVGNSDSGPLKFLPALWLLWPDMKFVFSYRNGINVVQSYFASEPVTPKLEVEAWKEKYGKDDFFSLNCERWARGIGIMNESKEWLASRAQCIETWFERVTSDLNELRELWDWIGLGKWEEYAERNARLMQTPINALTNKERIVHPEEIWQSWSSEQRKTFRDICGETMSQLGYSLPD